MDENDFVVNEATDITDDNIEVSSFVNRHLVIEKISELSNKSHRLFSLDALRGLTIILMITANYQINEPFPQIAHAGWNGFTIADSIFPTFIFVMGLAIPFALSKSEWSKRLGFKIIKRTCILFGLGLFLNGFPFTGPSSTFRIMGVLQRLGLCYLVTSILFLVCREKSKFHSFYLNFGFPLSALTVWFIITYSVNVPGCGFGKLTEDCSVQGYLDRKIWGSNRNYLQEPYDPEGFLSTITSCITCWLGLIAGMYLVKVRSSLNTDLGKHKVVAVFSVISLIMMFLSYALYTFLIISKPLWTPTFILLAGGCSLSTLAVLIYILDIRHSLILSKFLKYPSIALIAIGRNPLLIYVLSELIMATLTSISVPFSGYHSKKGSGNLMIVLYDVIFFSWLPDNVASLFLSQAFIWLFYVPIAYFLSRKGWHLRV